MEERLWPTSEGVMKKIKDDGDFDALRLKIIRVVKENGELRNSIVNQVKQSDIINQYVSEDMKPRQLSEAIFQELGRKIMGQISDEIWKVIRSNDHIKDDIKSTVESVLNKMAGTESNVGSKGTIPSPSRVNQVVEMEANIANPMIEMNMLSSNGTSEPLEVPSGGHRVDKSRLLERNEHEGRPDSSPQRGFRHTPESFAHVEALPANVGSSRVGAEADDESDLPPGFD